MKRKIIVFILFLFLISLSGCKKDDDSNNQQDDDNVVDNNQNNDSDQIGDGNQNDVLDEPIVSLDKEYYVIGEEIKFNVSNYASDEYVISFNDQNCVRQDGSGKYIARRFGEYEATITHNADASCTKTISFVIYAKQCSIDLTTTRIAVGDKIEAWMYSFENLYEESDDDFIFTVSDTNVASIEGRIVTAKAKGSFDIIATSKYNSNVTAKVTVTVGDNEDLFMLRIPYEYGTLKTGDQFYVGLSQGYEADEFVWSTNNSEVIRVVNMDGKCQVTIVGKGKGALICYNQKTPSITTKYTVNITEVGEIDYIGRFLTLAYEQVGIKEVGENGQKFGEWYKNPNQPWCAQFVSWCWFHAGLSNELLVKYQSCYQGMKWCTENGIMHYVQDYKFPSNETMENGIYSYQKENYTPKAGDIIFFLSNGAGHTGIVGHCDGEYIYTIEGNRSNRVDVWRIKLTNTTITGYASPNYPECSTVKDFSWLADQQADGSYLWTNVSAGDSTQ